MQKLFAGIISAIRYVTFLSLLGLMACTIESMPPVVGTLPISATATPIVPTATAVDTTPQVTAVNSPVNLRLGPGTQYDVAAVLAQNGTLTVVGRNADASWWQVSAPEGILWVGASVTQASNVDGVPVVAVPPTPTPALPTATATPSETATPTVAPTPALQYSIRNVFGQVNEAITQIRGDIRDGNGNPINGVRVRVRAGSFCTVSYPSGPPGGYASGGYDILLDNRAKDGVWQVAIVNGPADGRDTQCNDGLVALSEEVSVPTNTLEGVVFVEWRKNY